MSDNIDISDENPPPFPITRLELFNPDSTKLEVNLEQALEHPDDNNFIRNKIHNLSILIIDAARNGEKMTSFKINKKLVKNIVDGLQVNFPDVQIVIKTNPTNLNIHTILIFWT